MRKDSVNRNFQRLKLNNKGLAALVIALVVTSSTLILLGTVNYYIVSKTRYTAQVRETYQLMDAVEQATKIVKVHWDAAAYPPLPTPPPTTAAVMATMNSASFWTPTLTPLPPCIATCATLYPGGGALLVCIDSSNAALPYCFYKAAPFTASLDLRLRGPDPTILLPSQELILKVARYLKIDSRGSPDKQVLAGGLFSSTARATGLARGPDLVAEAPVNCSLPGPPPTCMACGPGTNHVCGSIFTCPKQFSTCSAATSTSSAGAFIQNFALINDNQ